MSRVKPPGRIGVPEADPDRSGSAVGPGAPGPMSATQGGTDLLKNSTAKADRVVGPEDVVVDQGTFDAWVPAPEKRDLAGGGRDAG